MSTVVVERMEKIISQSLAKKDQLFLAQRLHELEQEKRHKEEIAHIREEQVKLMAQLMLSGGYGAGSGLTDIQRKELLDNMQKIMEKPIVIQQVQSNKPSKIVVVDQSNSIKESIMLEDIRESNDDIREDIDGFESESK